MVNRKKSELTPQQVFNFVGYRFDLLSGRVLPTHPSTEATVHKKSENLFGQAVHVSHRAPYGNRKTGMGRSPPHETHSVASEATLACPREFGKSYSNPPLSPPTSRLVAGGEQYSQGSALAPPSTRSADIYRRLKQRLGRTLRGSTARGLWSEPENRLHINFLELKAVVLALKSFEHRCKDHIVLIAMDNTTVVSYINKKGGMRSGSLCALLWRLLSWCHPRKIVLRARHIPGCLNVIADKLSRHNQVIQTEWSLSQQVFHLLCSKWGRPQIDLFATRFNHRLPKFVSPVSDLAAWAVDALSLSWGNLDVYAFPPVSLLNQVVSKLVDQGCHRMILVASGWPNMPWFWDLVNLSRQIPFSLPLEKDLLTQPFNSLLHEVDVGSPSLKQAADFLLYLFKERHLQPSTIEGYRTAIADMIGNDKIHFGKDENLSRLLDSFHRVKPKGRRGVPSWNLSLVLHQLTKTPFEPMRKVSLKHLTFKTVFLLALGSGKRRSEIHAWLYRNIRHQENWSQVSLYPSPSFLSKNQLARDGPASVAPVAIPALAPSLDKSLKEDKSLCPVRALHYYLDRTKDLRAGKDLLFVSLRKSFQKDIVPAHIFLPGSNRLCCCAINFPTRKPKLYIRFGLMMSGPLQPPKLFKAGFLWIRSYRLVIGNLTTLLHSSI